MEEYCTKSMTYFILYGDDFPIRDFTKDIGKEPTQSYRRGEEFIKGKNKHIRYETAWVFGTDYVRTDYPEEQINTIVNALSSSLEIIKIYKEKYNLKCHIMTVIYFNQYQTRGLGINHKLIEFAHKIGAEYEFDIYNENVRE